MAAPPPVAARPRRVNVPPLLQPAPPLLRAPPVAAKRALRPTSRPPARRSRLGGRDQLGPQWVVGWVGTSGGVPAPCAPRLTRSLALSILPAAGATFGGKSAPQAGHSNPVNTHTQNTKFNPNPSERRTHPGVLDPPPQESHRRGARATRGRHRAARARCGRRAVSSWPRRATAGRGAMAGGA